MREISTKPFDVGEHVLVDGEEYVVEKPEDGIVLKGCDNCDLYDSGKTKCLNIRCGDLLFKKVRKEPTIRPYRDTEEMIADWEDRFDPDGFTPMVWVLWDNCRYLVTAYGTETVNLGRYELALNELALLCTYLDGSPCGKEVTE